MEEELTSFEAKCRCCLEDAKGDTYYKITSLTEERYFDFTATNLESSERLSSKICLTCNSLLARYSAIKKTFIDNQNKLRELLHLGPESEPMTETLIKVEVVEPGGYTVIELIEPFEEVESSNAETEPSKPVEDVKFKVPHKPKSKPPGQKRTLAKRKAANDKGVSKRTKKNNKTFNCDQCDYFNVNHPEVLVSHKYKFHNGPPPPPPRMLVCEVCSKEFKKGDLLKRHLDMHGNIKRFACDLCKFKTHARADIRQHLLTHLRNDPRVEHRCNFEDCSKVYRSKKGMKNHMRKDHLNEATFACEHCPKIFLYENLRRFHVLSVHENFRPYSCDVEGCTGTFISKSHVLRHKKNVHKDSFKC